MGRVELLVFVGLYACLYAFSVCSAYSFGHYRGVNANVDLARQEAFMDGVQVGADWQNNKHSLSCNGA